MTGCQGAPHGREGRESPLAGEDVWAVCRETGVKAVDFLFPDCKGLDQTRLQQFSAGTFSPSRCGLPVLATHGQLPILILPMKACGAQSCGTAARCSLLKPKAEEEVLGETTMTAVDSMALGCECHKEASRSNSYLMSQALLMEMLGCQCALWAIGVFFKSRVKILTWTA